jgi:outer membrane receptor protein involved in Fe transport
MVKSLLLTVFSLSSLLSAIAQAPGNNDQPVTATFFGRIIDAGNNRGIEAASVQLLQRAIDSTDPDRDSLIGGMLTMPNGDFNLENLPLSGQVSLVVSAIGYETYERKLDIKSLGRLTAQGGKDLGNIRLKVDPKILQSVTVTARRPLMALGIDRKVFNVERNITSAGGTAEDIMRNIPSLSVDIDGNVTLRNSSPQIFVDGRPTTLTLEQIPADAIESVEVITNPSARFDASGGTAGILNIVLKKNRKTGYNGSLRAGIDMRGKVNAGADINVRQNKINFFLNGNYRERKSISKGKTDRLTLISSPATQLFQNDRNTNIRDNFFGRGGFDYLIDNRNTLTVSGGIVDGNSEGETINDLYIDTLFSTGAKSSYSRRNSVSNGEFNNRQATIGFKHNFPKPGKEWTIDGNYNYSRNVNRNLISTYSSNQAGGVLNRQFTQLINGGGLNKNLNFQTDYVDPLSENSKLELGARLQIRDVDNSNVISYMDQAGNFTEVPRLSSEFANTDKVYAAYASFSNKLNRFGYQVGLRAESSEYSGEVETVASTGKDTAIAYGNRFPFSLFPSIFLTYQLSDDQELQLNVTRRINRPNFFQLFPFTDYSDSLNLSRGNPGLRPEFTYSAEMAWQKTYTGNNSFLASAYFKYTDQLITRSQERELNPVSGEDNLITTYINANSSYIGGLELTHRHNITSWWDLTSNLNLYTSRINVGDENLVEQGNIYSWFGEINTSFRLPYNLSLQISGEYRSKTILPPGGGGGGGGGRGGGGGGGGGGWGQPQSTSQGYIRPQGEVDIAVRYDFLKEKRASLTLSVGDVFRTDANNTYSESIYFKQNTYRLRDPQFVRLNFSWRFGKLDTSLFRRKGNRNQQGNEEEEVIM